MSRQESSSNDCERGCIACCNALELFCIRCCEGVERCLGCDDGGQGRNDYPARGGAGYGSQDYPAQGGAGYGRRDQPTTVQPSRGASLTGRSLVCYVRKPVARDLTRADDRFLDQVKRRMQSLENIRLDVRDWDDRGGNKMAPSVIICAATSRVGSDVDHALRGIEYDKKTALLIFHPVAKHVRAPGRTEDTLLDDKYLQLGAMIDVLFTGDDGPYDCRTNTDAIERLASFLRKRGASFQDD